MLMSGDSKAYSLPGEWHCVRQMCLLMRTCFQGYYIIFKLEALRRLTRQQPSIFTHFIWWLPYMACQVDYKRYPCFIINSARPPLYRGSAWTPHITSGHRSTAFEKKKELVYATHDGPRCVFTSARVSLRDLVCIHRIGVFNRELFTPPNWISWLTKSR